MEQLNMERIFKINSIKGIREKFNISDEEYVLILNVIHSMKDLPENTNRYEDVLFENIVRLIKKEDLSGWIGTKIAELMHDFPNIVNVHKSINKFENDKSPIKVFKIFCNVDEQLSKHILDYEIPSVSAISTLKEMFDIELRK